jgi:pimeloyl-ACP methyl ester carboxylesterase
VVDRGAGVPVVLLPGVQGRWEWMRPTVDALAGRCRVITFSLCGDRGSGMAVDPALGVENFARQIDAALDEARLERAVICGVSLGGLIALRYAATRPDRVLGLVLVATPGPSWTPDRVQAFCARHPLIAPPLFAASAVWRLWPELLRAFGGPWRAARFAVRHLGRIVAAPASPRRMRQRLLLWLDADRREMAARVRAPALVVTGDPGLDRVVACDGSLEYARLIAGARVARLESTGHIGLITRADRFAEIVRDFAEDVAPAGPGRNDRGAAG